MMTGRIGIAKRIHVIVQWDEWVDWGVAPCGFAGAVQFADPPPWCRTCQCWVIAQAVKNRGKPCSSGKSGTASRAGTPST